MKFALFLSLCIAAGMVQAAELFRWVDADGKVHYTDQPPPVSAKKVEEKNLKGSTIDTSELPFATQQAVKKSPVTLYTTNCGEPCKQANEHLAKRGIPYTTKNPETTIADAEALKKLIGMAYVPVLVVGSAVSKGYEKGTWDAALDAAGYPKSALPRKVTAPAESSDKATKKATEPADSAEKEAPAPVDSAPHPWSGGR